ncbi:MAG: YfcC family protein [Candidatus Spyradocola sp.]
MQNEKTGKGGLHVSTRSFLTTVAILLALMVLAGVLTRVLPQGQYQRALDASGNEIVVEGSYELTPEAERLPVWRWFTAPVEMLGDAQALTAVVIIVFILLVGGAFSVLDRAGVFRYLIAATIRRFGGRKYLLLCLISLLCMALGSTMGLLEETVPLVPLLVLLSLALGWDTLTGVGMSLLSVGFGFAAGTFNPFTVAVAQKLAGVPLFSGLWLRLIVFALIYALLCVFLVHHAKKVEKNPQISYTFAQDEARRSTLTASGDDEILANKAVGKAALAFVIALGCVFGYVLLALTIPGLSDYTMVVMALALPCGALIAGGISRYNPRGMWKDFGAGLLSMAPGAVLILLSMSVRHIIEQGGILDTLLHGAYTLLQGMTPFAAILILYGIVLVFQFFVSSAASKAFLIMPLIVPLADLIGLTRQSVVLAFCFGDGFTNVFFPTNAMLLIVLGMMDIPYTKWFKWTWKLQLAVLILTALLLIFAVSVGYA